MVLGDLVSRDGAGLGELGSILGDDAELFA